MTLREEQERVQKAVNQSLAHIQEDPWLSQRVLANVKGEEPVKRKISLALVLSIVGVLALAGTAYALFSSSRVAEFFGEHWNKELGESLQEGKGAQIGESVTIGDVVFTLDEIVYRNRALYGVGTARPVDEKDVIVPMDLADDPECFRASEDAQKLAAKAKKTGGKLLTITSMPEKIGVDEGTMLMPGTIGYYDIANEDGSVTFSFEASDGFAVNEGTSYQISMESSVKQIKDTGESIADSLRNEKWTVSCVPVIMETSTEKPDASEKTAAVIEQDGYELNVPSMYQETKTMPVYQALEIDFTAMTDPAWLNQSGVQDGTDKTYIRFRDHAALGLSQEGLDYNEFANDNFDETYSGAIIRVVWVREWPKHRGEFVLDRKELSGITLTEAQSKAEELIRKLGIDVNQYACVEALDMSLERIQAMGAIWEKAIADGELTTDDCYQSYDYASIPAEEEGYYLRYSPLGIDTFEAGSRRYSVELYINSRGIVYAGIRNPYVRGEVVETPTALMTPDEAIARTAEELGRSLSGGDKVIKSIQQVALTYEAVRAENKSDGMVFVPVWAVLYKDEEALRNETNAYALINAVDGSLIEASFR